MQNLADNTDRKGGVASAFLESALELPYNCPCAARSTAVIPLPKECDDAALVVDIWKVNGELTFET